MATSAEIANAYVSITTRMPGVKNDITKTLGGADVSAALKGSGKSMGQRLVDGFAPIAKVGLAAVGAVAAAGLGAALVKGFKRLDAIDTASAKLRGLGHDAATVDTIMANALASVKGTAFGLGDAATVAAQAVAAGVKPGKDLEGVLSTVANAAAAAGTDLGEMGSIFSKAMTQANGVQNDVIGQLADRGIPIYQELGKVLGVTSDKVFKMASEGKINFDQFAAAATAASGTVASEMGGTWSGLVDNMMASLGRIGEGILRGLFPEMKNGVADLTTVFSGFEAKSKEVGAAIGTFFTWIKENKDLVGILASSIGTLVAVVTAVYTGVKIWTAVQAILNVTLMANPLGAIIMGISLLVGAIVWIATQTTWFQDIWREFTRFLGEAWANISGFFVAAYENVIRPTFEGIGAAATWLYETILKPVFDGISAVVGFVAGVIKFNFDLVVNYFRFWGAVAGWLWKNAIGPALDAIGAAFGWLWSTIIKPVIDAIGIALQVMYAVFVKPVLDAIGIGLKVLGDVFTWLNVNVVQPVWTAISDAMKAAWNWIDTNVFTPFKKGIDLIAKGFEIAKSSIEKTWDGIKKAAAVPINFVLDTVWNNGLRSFWNDLVTELGLKDMKLAKAPLVKFASGGVLPGYTPGRDVHQFFSPTGGRLALSGGEAIMRPEFTRAVGGPAGVDMLNRMARTGQAFKNGGVFGELGNFAGDVWDNIVSAASTVGDFLTDPVKAIQKHIVDGIIRPLMGGGGNIFMKTVGQMPINLVKNLAKVFEGGPGKGVPGMGWQAMWNIVHNALPGARLTSGFRSAAQNAAANGAKGSYHMRGRAIDVVPASMATFNAIRSLFPNASELIYTPAGAAQLLNGKPFSGWSPKVKAQHYSHVHLAMANGGVVPKLYDQGGWLPHGGMAVNQSGKPEAVLTPEESQALRAGVAGGVTINGDIYTRDEAELIERLRREQRAALYRSGALVKVG
ncbi:MAG TPA: tape measure protein [Microbacterium sp.]|nr:tape measure protein [Microbacterium sp.]